MVAYATQSDVYRYGLPRGSLGNPGRLAESSLASTSTITLSEHGFTTGDTITLRATTGGTLSAPLVAGTSYFVLRANDSAFQVSSNGVTPITLTTDGISMMIAADLPFGDVLEYYSRFVDGFLPAHAVPLQTPYPITVVAIVASLSARRLQILSGVMSESMKDEELSAKAQLERWAKGIPARDAASSTKPTNLTITNQPVQPRMIGWVDTNQ